ncbi:hypothetical protein O181_103923 [Austropuccinia psidii MF-1]|uniref:Reverse transcriptase domain-containing protein n=1 Tax=Austropuccinia psidii MF-1 TaxID=1389203 RepID=A0A9Q3JL90_9BASI|nr:hypothetical protein [Austropuccinia psidii MF-1]
MDCMKGFYQNGVQPNSMKLLRIICHMGIYEYTRMPFGIKNAPAHFQRMMDTIFQDEILEGWMVVYIDDIIIYSETWEDHVQYIDRVLSKCTPINLKIPREFARCINVEGPIPIGGSPIYSIPYSVPPPSSKSSTAIPILASPMNPYCIPQPRPSPVLTSHLLQPVASTSQGIPYSVPPPPPKSSTAIPILASPMKPSPIPQPKPSPVLTSHLLHHVASTSQGSENWSALLFSAAQIFQNHGFWPIRVTREDPTVVNEGQYAVTRFFRRVD